MMGKYRVEIKKSAVKEIKSLPAGYLSKVLSRIEALQDNPRPHDSKKLSHEEKYRIRIGRYRVLYAIEDELLIIYVVKVAHRRDVYR